MQKSQDLIEENTELRARLALAEKWMAREVQASLQAIREGELRKSQRKHFENAFEWEKLDIITRRILDQYGDILDRAPKYTLERLIDAEIYWETLQRYPHMDGLPVVLAYQKILDAWIEERLIAGFRHREWSTLKRGDPGTKNKDSISFTGLLRASQWRELEGLERDIVNIITKNYTLSIGRLYQILELIREGSVPPLDKGGGGDLISTLVSYWKQETPKLLETLTSDVFFIPFSELMSREIFSKKRHEKKVTFSDAKIVRVFFNNLLTFWDRIF